MIADPLYSKILIPNNGEIQLKELKSYNNFFIKVSTKFKMAHGVLTNARKVFGQASGVRDSFERLRLVSVKFRIAANCQVLFLKKFLFLFFAYFLWIFLQNQMSGCLDNAHCPTCEIDLGEKRNTIASVVAGGLVSDLSGV